MSELKKEAKSVHELLEQLRAQGVAEEEFAPRVRLFLDFKAREKGVPYCGKFELTPLCNLDCKMCYVHLSRAQMGDTSLMPKEAWMRIMTEAAEMGMMEALFTGGECLTYPDFDALYLHAQELGVETVIYTNALLLDEKRIAFFKEHPPKDIQISLYGSSNDGYERVTGKRCFDTVLHNIKAAKAACLPIRIAVTPSIYLIDDAEEILRLAYKLDVPFSINAGLFDPRENTGRSGQQMDVPVEEYIRLCELRCSLCGFLRNEVDPTELPDVGGVCERAPGKGVFCGAGRSSFSVGYDGKMYMCGMLRTAVAHPLETGFRAAWECINKAAREFPVPGECFDCEYRAACNNCAARQLPNARVNPVVCAYTRRMVEAGLGTIEQ